MTPVRAVSPGRSSSVRLRARARDHALYPLVLQYRQRQSAANAQAVLEFVGETIRGRANRYKPVPPLTNRADLRQELIMAVLDTALSMPLTGPDFLERRLVLRACNRVSRALWREAKRQETLVDLESLEVDEEEDLEDL